MRRRGEVFSVTATAIVTSSLETDHFYTQTMVSLVMRLIWNMSLGDMLCIHVLTSDVIKMLTGVSQLVEYSLGGSPLMQFHNDDFQAVFYWFLTKEKSFSGLKGS